MRYPNLNLNLDFCGTCHGSCVGCLLSDEERRRPTAFLRPNDLDPLVSALQQAGWGGQLSVEHLVLGFGRGNTLMLSDTEWQDLYAIARRLKNVVPHAHCSVEISTSLIGKIEPQIATALRRREEAPDLDLRFVVVANADLFSDGYWLNLRRFFERMAQARGGGEHSGDVVVLNLHANRLPKVQDLLDRVQGVPFPVNVVVLPLYRTGFPEDRALNDHLHAVEAWWAEWARGAQDAGLDSNLVNYLDAHGHAWSGLGGAHANLLASRDSVWFVQKDGQVNPGLFTVFGDMDPVRTAHRLMQPFPPLNTLSRRLMKAPACVGCPVFTTCYGSGGAVHAVLNQQAMGPSDDPSVCWSGLRQALVEHAESRRRVA